MSKFLGVLGKPQSDLQIPDGFVNAAEDTRSRNGEAVSVVRYQKPGRVVMNNPHVTAIFGRDGRLISYNNFAVDSDDPLPAEEAAVHQAARLFAALDPHYARGLSFMRVDRYNRHFTDDHGVQVEIPVLWVKFAHRNGSYNWVSVGPGGQIIEMERESEWDYFRSRRATEEWNYDDWVLARAGKGPQLAAPEALA